MASTELDEKAKKILEHLKKADKPLTLDEIVEGLKMERKAVVESMLPLVQKGIITAYIREKDGKLEAVYVAL
ncbi:hypothetical protein DRO19_01355 [Candidatus Bathyarchaeota archaeon]|nr:MAG: hypothetical protein DRO19_01355 [Candidatus Bathyarchaeota archaeon]